MYFHSVSHFSSTFYDDEWLRTLASLDALTNLDLKGCDQVMGNGLRSLAGLPALTALPSSHSRQQSSRRRSASACGKLSQWLCL